MISHLSLKNFRSHTSKQYDFSEKTNIILGKNGSGKTNILEAILVLAQGKSYRASDDDLIHNEESEAKISGEFDGKYREIRLQRNSQKNFNINNTKFKRLTFNNTVPVVLFEPDFTQIISRGPEKRREYFDSLLSRIDPSYQVNLNKYKRTLSQRNTLLKSPKINKEEMFIWNIKLSELGGHIAIKRIELVEKINQELGKVYSELASKKSEANIVYSSKNKITNYSESLLRGLEKNLNIDKEYGFTSLGPHRDDYKIMINNQEAITSSSRGENRTLLLSLKIIETNLIKNSRQISPILLLDDVFSELDEGRQGKLIEFFYDNQVVITTTSMSPIMKGVSGNIIEL